ncbi:hypothetical protein O9K51_00695 [Purpureocillium lavendulum]|uniref:Uncharacterized protein n=1 Tax=Purpureocillium lavendulum TaxID=1247861 RepID=A0AB34G2U0_9HYPO|nr:hypothetical protein O9K51_00695 [Purpureocillium lavendulum]
MVLGRTQPPPTVAAITAVTIVTAVAVVNAVAAVTTGLSVQPTWQWHFRLLLEWNFTGYGAHWEGVFLDEKTDIFRIQQIEAGPDNVPVSAIALLKGRRWRASRNELLWEDICSVNLAEYSEDVANNIS